jgi:uncharacterized membrane protein
MKFIVFAVLAVVAFALVAGFIIGVTLELIGLGIMALIVVAAVTFVMRKIRGPKRSLDRPLGRERLPR